MRTASRRLALTAALAALLAPLVGFNGCVPSYAMEIMMPPNALSTDDYVVYLIDAHGMLVAVPYPEFVKVKNVRKLFEEEKERRRNP